MKLDSTISVRLSRLRWLILGLLFFSTVINYVDRQALSVLLPKLVAANFHASLLPAYRGKHPLFWALRHGELWTGLTVHVMAPGFDTGEILYQIRVRTSPSISDAWSKRSIQ